MGADDAAVICWICYCVILVSSILFFQALSVGTPFENDLHAGIFHPVDCGLGNHWIFKEFVPALWVNPGRDDDRPVLISFFKQVDDNHCFIVRVVPKSEVI